MRVWTVFVAFLGGVACCPTNYKTVFEGKCIRYVTVTAYFGNALTTCRTDGGDLLSIHSQQENDWVLSSITNGAAAWIGFQCNATNRVLSWTDGSAVDYIHYNETLCDGKDFIISNPQEWVAESASTYHNYICYYDQQNCNYYLEDSSSCLSIVKAPASWDDAEAYCASQGQHLVSIHSATANEYIRQLAISHGLTNGIHIGAQTSGTNMNWTDGSSNNYKHFATGMPNDIFGTCVAQQTGSSAGDWVSVHCGSLTKLPYICSMPGGSMIVPPTCPTTNNTFLYDGDVYSPGYPVGYSANLSCEYFIAAKEGRRVELRFRDFEVNSCCDTVTLYEGNANGTPLAVLNGSVAMTQIFQTVSDNIMRIVFTTKGAHARGWHAEFASEF